MGNTAAALVEFGGMWSANARIGGTFYGGSRGDTIFGGGDDDLIDGKAGNNVLHGMGGDDYIYSGLDFATDDCTLFGGDGDDQMKSVDGNDLLYGGAGNDLMDSRRGLDTIYGGLGNDTVSFRYDPRIDDGGMYIDLRLDALPPLIPPPLPIPEIFGVENVIGSWAEDTIIGNAIANVLKGSTGDDLVFGGGSLDAVGGGAGNDRLQGDAGRDTLFGDHGNDTLNGGTSMDVLYGARGADQFVFDVADRAGLDDRIGDFEAGVDRFVVAGLAQGSAAPDVRFEVRDNGFTIVRVGDAGAPIFTIAVRATDGVMMLADFDFAFVI